MYRSMKLLVTGAFPASPQQCDALRENGFSLYFQQDERGAHGIALYNAGGAYSIPKRSRK